MDDVSINISTSLINKLKPKVIANKQQNQESIFVEERGVKIPKHCPKLPCDVSFPNPSTGSGLTIPTPVRSVEGSQSSIATDAATYLSIQFSTWTGQVMERLRFLCI